MDDEITDVIDKIANKINSIPKEGAIELNQRQLRLAELEYTAFKREFKQDKCYLCDSRLDLFNLDRPCLHWFLRPTSLKKRFFPLLYGKFDFFQINSYLRWVANQEVALGNINDTTHGKEAKKIIEMTIRYKNIEWSFSCTNADFRGHEDTKEGKYPHYHLQMRIDGKSFIDYSDFHIPFTKGDIITLNMKMSHRIVQFTPFGEGMEDAMKMEPKLLLKSLKTTDRESYATFRISTIVEPEPGQKIPGDLIADVMRRSRKSGIPMAKLFSQNKNFRTRVTLHMADGVPEIDRRKKRKR